MASITDLPTHPELQYGQAESLLQTTSGRENTLSGMQCNTAKTMLCKTTQPTSTTTPKAPGWSIPAPDVMAGHHFHHHTTQGPSRSNTKLPSQIYNPFPEPRTNWMGSDIQRMYCSVMDNKINTPLNPDQRYTILHQSGPDTMVMGIGHLEGMQHKSPWYSEHLRSDPPTTRSQTDIPWRSATSLNYGVNWKPNDQKHPNQTNKNHKTMGRMQPIPHASASQGSSTTGKTQNSRHSIVFSAQTTKFRNRDQWKEPIMTTITLQEQCGSMILCRW